MTTSPVNEALAGVEAELAAFWAAPDVSAGEAVKVRASTMSFVVVSSQANLEHGRELSVAIAETHAGRALLLALDGRIAPWEMTTEVQAVCRIEGSVPVCYDRVEILFGAMAVDRAPSIVRALALPEVPIVMEVTPGAPDLLVNVLAPICDRIIVDSFHTPLDRVAQLTQLSRGPTADRAWVRTFSWRELVARFFDHDPSIARRIRRIEIERTGGGKVDPAGLFLGWMASRLAWSFTSRTEAKDASGQLVEITVAEDRRTDLPLGVLSSVRISADTAGAPLCLSVARTDAQGGRQVRWMMTGSNTKEHEHPLGFRDETWVLIKTIDSTEGDQVYRAAAIAGADWSAR